MSILEEIFDHKRKEVADSRRQKSITELESQVDLVPPQSDFKTALRKDTYPGVRLIAENALCLYHITSNLNITRLRF